MVTDCHVEVASRIADHHHHHHHYLNEKIIEFIQVRRENCECGYTPIFSGKEGNLTQRLNLRGPESAPGQEACLVGSFLLKTLEKYAAGHCPLLKQYCHFQVDNRLVL